MEIFIGIIVLVVVILIIRSVKNRGKDIKVVSLQPVTNRDSFKPVALIIDTETTGLFIDNSIRATKKNVDAFPDNFPRIVQLCYMLIDKNGNYDGEVFYIKQKQDIPKQAMKIHGITNEMCEKHGDELEDVMLALSKASSKVDNIVGHNISYDYKVVQSDCLKANITFPLRNKNKIDTMGLVGKALGHDHGYKISLYNAGEELFGNKKEWEELKSKLTTHNAESDVIITAMIYNFLIDL